MVLELHEVATIHIRQGLVTEILISFLLSIWLLKKGCGWWCLHQVLSCIPVCSC